MRNTRRNAPVVFVRDGVKHTVAGAQPAPAWHNANMWSKHLGKSDSASARATGRHNKG